MISGALIIILLLALSFLIWKLMWDSHSDGDNWDLEAEENKVDLEVLELLLSCEEDRYLRTVLSPQAFRSIKRKRMVLARKYLKATSKNTGHLIKAAELVKSSSKDQELLHTAHEFLTIAFRVRLNVPIVYFYLWAEWLFPRLTVRMPIRINNYREMTTKVIFILKRTQLLQTTKTTPF
jgi:hypothetical protein